MSKINLIAAAAVATQGLQVLGVQFDAYSNAKTYYYLAKTEQEIPVDSFVIVPVGDTRLDAVYGRNEQYTDHVKTAKVVSLHGTEAIDIYAEYEPRFIVGVVDLAQQAQVTEQLGAVAEHLRVGQTRSAQQQVLAMLGVQEPLQLGANFSPSVAQQPTTTPLAAVDPQALV